MYIKNFTLLSLILAVFLHTPNVFASGALIFEDSFDEGVIGDPPNDWNRDSLGYWDHCSGNCTIVTDEVVRSGGKALKTYLNRITSNVSYRTEAVPRGEARNDPLIEGIDYWYGFSIYIPSSHVPDDLSRDIIAQWHGANGRNPPVNLHIKGDDLALRVRYDVDGQQKSKLFSLGQYPKGSWMDFVFHFRWSSGNTGVMNVWKNGDKVISYQGANAYDDPGIPWLKIGLYKTAWREGNEPGVRFDENITERIFYHDEVRIAKGVDASFAAVDPSRSLSQPLVLEKPSKLAISKK